MDVRRVVHLDLGSTWRGGQQQVVLLHRELRSMGWDSVVLAPERSRLADRCRREGLPLRGLPPGSPYRPACLVRVWRQVGTTGILHAHDSRAAALAAVVRRMRPRTRFVCHRRVSYPLGRSVPSRWKYRQADGWVAVSEEIAAGLRREVPPSRPVATAHSALDEERVALALAGDDRRELLREFGLRADAPVVGCCGALSPQKGHRVLLEAAPSVVAENPDAVFLVVGEGALRGELERRVRELDLGGHFRFTGFRGDALELTRLFTVAVVPSVDGEGSSAAVKEAMALGVPVVVSDLAGNLEVAAGACLSVPRGDPASLARAVRGLLSDPGRRAALAAAGRARAAAFTAGSMAEAVAALYLQVLGGRA